ncbi:MAG: hypothetical protein JXB32_10395 [Deltaproteobacteria bacterium]|nr:hypothetical protein [Deltaproteobacteria bacterium]
MTAILCLLAACSGCPSSNGSDDAATDATCNCTSCEAYCRSLGLCYGSCAGGTCHCGCVDAGADTVPDDTGPDGMETSDVEAADDDAGDLPDAGECTYLVGGEDTAMHAPALDAEGPWLAYVDHRWGPWPTCSTSDDEQDIVALHLPTRTELRITDWPGREDGTLVYDRGDGTYGLLISQEVDYATHSYRLWDCDLPEPTGDGDGWRRPLPPLGGTGTGLRARGVPG